MKKSIAILAAFALVAGFAVTATAADWNFYGHARMATFSVDKDKDSVNKNPNLPAGDSEADTMWTLQGNARIGATVKAGDVGGGFEYGSGPNLRKLYGTWDFGGGELLVGQTYTPTVQFLSNQVYGDDAGLLGAGQFYRGRRPMIQLKFGGFKIALVDPNANSAFAGTGFSAIDIETTLPQIEASYRFSTDMFWVEPMAGYSTYDMVAGNGDTEGVDSWVAGVYFGFNLGPATIKSGGYLAQNSGTYGVWQGVSTAATLNGGNPIYANGGIQDNDEMGAVLVAGFTINDMLGFEAGAGYKANEIEVGSASAETEIFNYYAQLPITLADGVYIIPEVGYLDFGEIEVTGLPKIEQGADTYFGAKWQINF
ncbi:MAG: hypothetical protein K9L59_13180 [Desulfobacterales bacterium]|nr:hypothetical protein [Desulfobacterales bacterium]